MRFKQSQLLKNVSRKELLAYQKETGFMLFGFSYEEMTMAEMITGFYGALKSSSRWVRTERFDPIRYLNHVDMRKRVIMDISRCLVTAKRLGEDIGKSGPAEEIFDFMIRDLSLHARCLSKKALPAGFGDAYYEASCTLFSEVCALIRRLKLTREGYAAIQPIPGAVLCDSPKTLSAEKTTGKKETKTERSVRPEHAVSPLPTTVSPESVETEAKNDLHDEEAPVMKSENEAWNEEPSEVKPESETRNEELSEPEPESETRNEEPSEAKPEIGSRKTETPEAETREQRTEAIETKTAEPESGDEENEPDKIVLSDEEIEAKVRAYEDPYSINDRELMTAYMNIVLRKLGIRQKEPILMSSQ